MNVLNILTKVGTSLLKNAIPGVGLVLDTVNAFLPDDKKLTGNETGTEAIERIGQLPADQQAQIYSKELDVEIKEIEGWTNVMTVLAQSDASGSSTRPMIAKMMAWLVVIESSCLGGAYFYAVVAGKTEMVTALQAAWPTLLALLGTPTALLRAYFGLRTKEKERRYQLAGNPAPAGMISGIINAFKGGNK
jgi:hypothetical protein